MRQHVEDSFDYQLPSLLQRHSARYFCKSLESVFEVSFFLLFVSFLSQNLDTLKNWRIIVRRCMIIGKFKLTGRLQGGQPAPQTPPTSGSAAYTASGGGFNDVLNRWGCLLNWLFYSNLISLFISVFWHSHHWSLHRYRMGWRLQWCHLQVNIFFQFDTAV